MALPAIIEEALMAEAQEGRVWQEIAEKLQEKVVELTAKIDSLLAAAAADELDDHALLTELNLLKAQAIDLNELKERIMGINPTPASDAVITEVIDNPAIETPSVIEDAPEASPDLIQDDEVISAAVAALSNFTDELEKEEEDEEEGEEEG